MTTLSQLHCIYLLVNWTKKHLSEGNVAPFLRNNANGSSGSVSSPLNNGCGATGTGRQSMDQGEIEALASLETQLLLLRLLQTPVVVSEKVFFQLRRCHGYFKSVLFN
jgi:hypothetical protein